MKRLGEILTESAKIELIPVTDENGITYYKAVLPTLPDRKIQLVEKEQGEKIQPHLIQQTQADQASFAKWMLKWMKDNS